MIKEDNDIQLKMLLEFEKQLIDNFNFYSEEQDFNKFKSNLKWFLQAWGNSRIDIKNQGTELNSLKFYTNEIKYNQDIKIGFPNWFIDKSGKGAVIKYNRKKLMISFKCVKKGKLHIKLRGDFYTNLKQERVPIYVNYQIVSINYKKLLDENIFTYHDKPHIISLNSYDNYRLNLKVESKTIYHYFPKLKTFFNNLEDEDDLIEEYFDLISYIISEKDILRNTSDKEKPQINNNFSNNNLPIKKPKIALFGSCVSGDLFRSYHNNYKADFVKLCDHQRSTIISLMSPKIDYNEDELNYLKDAPDKEFINKCIKNDFDKEIFKYLEDLDYLIINLVHDVRWGVLEYENRYLTNNNYIRNTKFYQKNQEKIRKINILKNPQEYFDLWTESCDKFFEYISINYPNLKVILQKIELIYQYLSSDGSYETKKNLHKQALKLNPYFIQFESYIEDNFDVNVIPFPYDTCGDEGHIWGLYSTHYTRTYYQYVYDKIKLIALEDIIEEGIPLNDYKE